MMRASIAIVGACALVSACGGATPTSTTAPSPAPAAVLPLADMQYVAEDEGNLLVTLSLHADGSIETHGRTAAHIVGRQVICDDGSELLHVDDADDVVIEGKIVAHLLADGSFQMDQHFGHWSVTVRDDGDVVLTTKAEGAASTHALRWQPFHVEARRTASLLTGFLTPTFAGMWCGERKPTNPQ